MKLVKFLGKVVGILVLILVLFVLVLSVTEYRPEEVEEAKIYKNEKSAGLDLGKDYSITSFNIGYAGLGESADFFMDGGKKVRPDSKDQVVENLDGINKILDRLDSDFYLLQEVDENSTRTYKINQADYLQEAYNKSFAYNYKVLYVPYPLPTMGSINSGLLTLSKEGFEDAQRLDLYNPFKWPMRVANLNRGLLVNSYKIENSDKKLYLVNLHMDAYDQGDGRKMQTRQLVEFMEEKYGQGDYVIAGGDFNQLLPGAKDRFKDLDHDHWKPKVLDEAEVGEDFKFALDEDQPTCRSLHMAYDHSEDFLQYYIDGFLLSPNVEVEEVGLVDEGYKYSDHNPVEMKFRLK